MTIPKVILYIKVRKKLIHEKVYVDEFESQLDTCKISKGIFGNFIINMIADQLEEFSNFRFQCPQRPGYYYCANFPLTIDKYVPMYLMNKGFWEFSLYSKFKNPKTKKMVVYLSVKVHGTNL